MNQIRYFLALGDTLNFTRAAERCNVTQPALTRAIRALEEELGGKLLRRERSLSHLTELGARMLPLMHQCYETAVTAKSLAQSVRKGDTALLSLAISQAVDMALLVPILRALARAFPGLQLKLQRGSAPEIAELLRSGRAELAVAGPMGEAWERLDAYALFVERFELVVNREHKLAQRRTIDFEDLRSERIVIHAGCEMENEIRRRLAAKDLASAIAHQASAEADLGALLEANIGVAILPESTARSDGLARVQVNGLDLTRTISVYAVAGRRRTTVGAAMLNALRAAQWPSDPPIRLAKTGSRA